MDAVLKPIDSHDLIPAEEKSLNKGRIRYNIMRERNFFRAKVASRLSTEIGEDMAKGFKGMGIQILPTQTFADALVGMLFRQSFRGDLKAIKLIAELIDIPDHRQLAPDGLMTFEG